MNDALHWNKIAPNYDKEIFNVFKNDKKKKLKKYVLKYADKNKSAIDFGCGVGKALPLLSPLFKEIIAVDVSEKCIEKARAALRVDNVSFQVVDLAAGEINLPHVDFAFCCNVAMSDDVKRNQLIITNVLHSLNKGGVALFVLPALESVSISALSLINWYRREGTALCDIPKDELALYSNDNPQHIAAGIVKIDTVSTKHYLFTELYALFNTDAFEMQHIDRLEYDWSTEFDSPPSWMQSPFPWDWVIEVKRVK
jgi:SAM-dependent methyltransferase